MDKLVYPRAVGECYGGTETSEGGIAPIGANALTSSERKKLRSQKCYIKKQLTSGLSCTKRPLTPSEISNLQKEYDRLHLLVYPRAVGEIYNEEEDPVEMDNGTEEGALAADGVFDTLLTALAAEEKEEGDCVIETETSLDGLFGTLEEEGGQEEAASSASPPPPKRQRKKIPACVRKTVWNRFVGENSKQGPCYVCERTIDFDLFHLGHVIPICLNGTDSVNNLRPICSNCNGSMRTRNLEEFKAEYF